MSGQKILTAAVATAALASLSGAPAVSNDGHGGKRRLAAELRGAREVPAVSTEARGSFRARISHDESEVAWRLEYKDLTGTVTQAHIHFGDHHTNGGISVWFCANNPPITNAPAGTPPCPTPDGELSGTFLAANVVGPTGQGIGAGEFAEFVKALRSGLAYANVHTTTFGGGEIRGQIRVVD
jgi:hypothetical protein